VDPHVGSEVRQLYLAALREPVALRDDGDVTVVEEVRELELTAENAVAGVKS